MKRGTMNCGGNRPDDHKQSTNDKNNQPEQDAFYSVLMNPLFDDIGNQWTNQDLINYLKHAWLTFILYFHDILLTDLYFYACIANMILFWHDQPK